MWSETYKTSGISLGLSGDKIRLPPSALGGLINTDWIKVNDDGEEAASGPLTFLLRNPANGRKIYAGVQEFTAAEGHIECSDFLNSEISENVEGEKTLTVTALALPKGSGVRFRPLEAGYDPADWKALLEKRLRPDYTTLTEGTTLTFPGPSISGHSQEFKFLVDKLSSETPLSGAKGVCIVDTDLEVDIEPLNEDQARENLRQRLLKTHATKARLAAGSSADGTPDVNGTDNGQESSKGRIIGINGSVHGQVHPGDYVDYDILLPENCKALRVSVSVDSPEYEVDVFISPFNTRQRAVPRQEECFVADYSSIYPKELTFLQSNTIFDDTEKLYVSIKGSSLGSVPITTQTVHKYHLTVSTVDKEDVHDSTEVSMEETNGLHADETKCKNCHQWVPSRTMMLHESFCYRNNVLCHQCGNVFQKSSEEWKSHWHCQHDEAYGTGTVSKEKHDYFVHTPKECGNCPYKASNLPDLAQHRTSVCPGKYILCRFCHLEVPQEGDPFEPNPEAVLSGLTVHELADGARTTECDLCAKIVKLRDLSSHMKHHDIERFDRPLPTICRNVNCGRTLYGVGKKGAIGTVTNAIQIPGNGMGLCKICYGPLYVSTHDPEGKALYRRLERRYLTQMLTGCKQKWCKNEFCKQGRVGRGAATEEEKLPMKDMVALITPFVQKLRDTNSPLHFCVGENNQRSRDMAEMLELANESVYEFAWCIAAIEATGHYAEGSSWLINWAPKKGEKLH